MDEIKIKRPRMNGDEIWVTDFTPESAQDFRERLLSESNDNPDKPIIIYIDSYGGQVDALSKMIATMDEVPNPLITVTQGKAMSCGSILLSHGDVRFCDPHARVMVHRVSAGTIGDVDDMKNDLAEIERLNKYWMGFLAANCCMPNGYDDLQKFIKSKDGSDRYLTAEEALKMGLVDVVGRPQIAQQTVYEVLSGPEKISIHKRAKIRSDRIEKSKPKKKVQPKKRRTK